MHRGNSIIFSNIVEVPVDIIQLLGNTHTLFVLELPALEH